MSDQKKSPLQIVKDTFGGKDELAAKVAALLEPGEGEDKDDFVGRLKHVANAKLLHLLAMGERFKELGGREKLVAKVAELKGQAKDNDFITKLTSLSPGRLIDLHDSLSRRAAGKAKRKPRAERKRKRVG